MKQSWGEKREKEKVRRENGREEKLKRGMMRGEKNSRGWSWREEEKSKRGESTYEREERSWRVGEKKRTVREAEKTSRRGERMAEAQHVTGQQLWPSTTTTFGFFSAYMWLNLVLLGLSAAGQPETRTGSSYRWEESCENSVLGNHTTQMKSWVNEPGSHNKWCSSKETLGNI